MLRRWAKRRPRDQGRGSDKRRIYVVAHTHGTVSGWLAPFQTERNYVVNNHAGHIRHLANSRPYVFACSEVPNLIALRQLLPDAFRDLMDQVARHRAELVNAFFLEPTINLTHGETLMRMGIEGLRWQREACGVEPRFAWMIDVVGVNAQTPAVADHLGLQAMIYSRNCPGSPIHWWESPSGAKVLAVSQGRDCYLNWRLLFSKTDPFERLHAQHLHKSLKKHLAHTPPGLPVLWMVAGGDYGEAPARGDQMERLLDHWTELYPDLELVFELPSAFLDDCLKAAETASVPVARGDNLFSHNAFWVNSPPMKQAFRRSESRLLAVESAAALLNVAAGRAYPAEILRDAWHLLFLNADRGLLWGIGSGDAFYGSASWTAEDRFQTIQSLLDQAETDGSETAVPSDGTPVFFRPRADASAGLAHLRLPAGTKVAGIRHDAWQTDEVVAGPDPDGMGFFPVLLEPGHAGSGEPVDVPGEIVTPFYRARICPSSGNLLEITLAADRPVPILSGPANRLRFEHQPDVALKEDFLAPRDNRRTIETVVAGTADVSCVRDDISLVVRVVESLSGGGSVCRRLRFFDGQPVIDADIEMNDVPEDLLVSVDFPLATAITRDARAVPFGFSERDPRHPALPPDHFLMTDHAQHGINAAAVPAVGWSWHGNERGTGLALLDRGVPGRESHRQTASLLLMNTSAGFRGMPNRWLSGAGRHSFRYALLATARGWRDALVPAWAAALNFPMQGVPGKPTATGSLLRASPNLSVQAVRRQGRFLEVRCVEALGRSGLGTLTIAVEHYGASRGTTVAAVASLDGRKLRDGSTEYTISLAPQEIVTLRFDVGAEMAEPTILMDWAGLVPTAKRARLSVYDPALKGHPPER